MKSTIISIKLKAVKSRSKSELKMATKHRLSSKSIAIS